MIAVIGTPGSIHHEWCRFRSHKEAEEWLTLQEQRLEILHPAACPQPTRILTEKEAESARWMDGRKVYPRNSGGSII